MIPDVSAGSPCLERGESYVGAQAMADLCMELESLGMAHSVEGAPATLERLECEFERVKNEIAQESLIH